VQSTLLGLTIALIVVLVTALVGPLFIDWSRWRTSFEAEATRLVGMPVRVSGAIDARLLPTPTLQLNGIEIGEPGHEPRLRARALGVEFALTPLMRGEWHASQLHLDTPQVTLGVDRSGRIEVPPVSIRFDPDQLSFDRVEIANGRAVLLDAASGTRTVLDQVSFNGDIRSLLGPFRGDGAFVVSGRRYDYRVSGGRRGDDGGMRLRLSLDPGEHAPSLESEGTLWVEAGHPRYQGTLTLAGQAGAASASRQGTTAASSWRATSKVTATPGQALFEQIDFQYGPDERALRLAGTADLTFGAQPSFEAVLSARQVDVDRVLRLPDAAPRAPIALLRDLTDTLAQFTPPPVPVTIGVGIDNVTLGGASLIGLHGDMHAEGDGWSLDNIEFRAPGGTQVHASGLLSLAPGAPEFAGPARIDAADPKVLIAWLEGRSAARSASIGSFSARGDVTLGATRLAVERLNAEFDGKAVQGRLAYAFEADRRPARLDAALEAAQIDLDGALAFASNAFAGTKVELPREIALKLDFGRAIYAGVEAKGASADLRYDARGLDIQRLAIADFGGAVVSGQGHIDTTSSSWRGSLAFSLEAQQLAGVAALAAKFAPGAVDLLRTTARRAAPAKLNAKLEVAPAADGGANASARTNAKLTVDGLVAGVRVNVVAQGNGDAASPAAADIRLDGRLDDTDGAGLAALLGLDRLALVDHHAASLVLAANGPANGDLRVDANFSGGGLDAGARGTLRLADAQTRGALDVSLAASDARLLHREQAAAVPVVLTTHLSLDGDHLELAKLDGKIADSRVTGGLALVLGHPLRIDGHLDADTVDAAAVIASAIGAPAARSSGAVWSQEPFGPGPLADADGRLAFKVTHARFIGGTTGEELQGTVRFEPSAIALEKLAGRIAGGAFTARADLRAAPTGLSASLQASLADADIAALLPRDAGASGRISFQFDAAGTGLSPAALIGAVRGTGSAAAENLQLAGLDPRAIETASAAAEHGSLLDPVRIGDIVRTALAGGALDIPDVGGTIAINDGRLSFAPLAAPAQNADVTIRGGYDLGQDALDIGLDLAGAPSADMATHARPQLSISFKGPFAAPRRNVDVSALVRWLTERRVEREAKRLEAAEREAKRLQAEEQAQEAEARRRAQERAQEEARRAEQKKAAAQRAAEQAAAATRPAAPGADKAPDLPPPIEIPSTSANPPPKPRLRRMSPPRAAPRMPAPPLVITPPEAR
jgi:uncharacterized protein involved in outer membrane biogenesis